MQSQIQIQMYEQNIVNLYCMEYLPRKYTLYRMELVLCEIRTGMDLMRAEAAAAQNFPIHPVTATESESHAAAKTLLEDNLKNCDAYYTALCASQKYIRIIEELDSIRPAMLSFQKKNKNASTIRMEASARIKSEYVEQTWTELFTDSCA